MERDHALINHPHDLESMPDADSRQVSGGAAIEKFMLAGNATFTLVGQKSRFTYKVTKPDDFNEERPSWFVSVMNGPDNERDFSYIGLITGAGFRRFRMTKGSRLREDAPSVKAFIYCARWLFERDDLPDTVEFWHEGRCGRCNRRLTVPESIEQGYGPECINYV